MEVGSSPCVGHGSPMIWSRWSDNTSSCASVVLILLRLMPAGMPSYAARCLMSLQGAGCMGLSRC
jgi:hypothetical protein